MYCLLLPYFCLGSYGPLVVCLNTHLAHVGLDPVNVVGHIGVDAIYAWPSASEPKADDSNLTPRDIVNQDNPAHNKKDWWSLL